MKRARHIAHRPAGTSRHMSLILIAALSMIGGCATQRAAQSPASTANAEHPRNSQILEIERGDVLSDWVKFIDIVPPHGSVSCDNITQIGLGYRFESFDKHGIIHIVCAKARLGNTYATPQFLRAVKGARVGDYEVAIAPAETVLTRADADLPPKPPRLTPGASYLLLNGVKLIIHPDDRWSQKGNCEASRRVLVGQRGNADLCADVIATETPQPATGSFILSHWKSNTTCTFAVPTGTMARRHYHFLDWESGDENHDHPWGPCTANTTHSIQLENVPSAVRILLTDDAGCDIAVTGNEFWIELRTTAKSVTLNAIPLDEIMTYQPGSIVRPGLQLVGSYLMHGKSAQRNLGCIKVTTSAAPPAP